MIPVVKAQLLEGKRGLIVGIANDPSIAWGCAKAFRALGVELAVTYLNDKARKYVEPLAQELEAPITMPLDVGVSGQKAVFERIGKDWGELDSRPLHRLLTKDRLQGRVVDAPPGRLHDHGRVVLSFIAWRTWRSPLEQGGTLFTMTYYGNEMMPRTKHHGRGESGA